MIFSVETKTGQDRDVHVVLVSLLAYQLSSQFLIFFCSSKKKLSSLRDQTIHILSTLLIFLSSLLWKLDTLKKNQENGQNINCPVSETGQFFLAEQKKWEIDWTIGRPRNWQKPHGRPFSQSHCSLDNLFAVLGYLLL